MPRRTGPRITLSSRPVVAVGAPFSPYQEPLHSADVALDWISDLRPRSEPLVLRVSAAGGTAEERARVAGDWLCEADGSAPARLPPPVWNHSDEAKAWSRRRPWLESWEECRDARWMLHAAAATGVDLRVVVLAACACVRTALRYAARGDDRPRRAVEMAEAWARDEAYAVDVLRAADAAGEPGRSVGNAAAYAAYAAASSYSDDDREADDPSEAYVYVAYAAHYAAASSSAGTNQMVLALRELATLVRSELPTITVLRAAASSLK